MVGHASLEGFRVDGLGSLSLPELKISGVNLDGHEHFACEAIPLHVHHLKQKNKAYVTTGHRVAEESVRRYRTSHRSVPDIA
eukprot:1481033-Rhodomonas_salina.2